VACGDPAFAWMHLVQECLISSMSNLGLTPVIISGITILTTEIHSCLHVADGGKAMGGDEAMGRWSHGAMEP
jgi:hypothetical protein